MSFSLQFYSVLISSYRAEFEAEWLKERVDVSIKSSLVDAASPDLSVTATNHINSSNLNQLFKNFDKSDNGLYKCSVNGFEGEYSKSVVIDGILN